MDDGSRINGAFEAVDWDWTAIRAKVEPVLVGVATAAGEEALQELGLFSPDVLARMRRNAKEFAVERAAEMVGMERRGDLLLPNPDPEWTISDATRDMIRSTVNEALSEGWSAQETARAIRENEGFSAARANTIARTEIAIADVKGTLEGWKASGLVAGKQWLTAPDCCDECQDLDGQVVALDEEFPEGDPPLHPNCVPGDSLVTPGGRISGVSQRWYDGNLVVILTASGKRLSCTPNHPILTPSGWVAAGALNVGGHVISSRVGDRIAGQGSDDENVPTRIEDIAKAFRSSEQVTAVPVPVSAEHFHGDGEGSEVAIIWADRLLLNGPNASNCKKCGKQLFVIGDVQPLEHDGIGALNLLVDRVEAPASRIIGGASVGLPFDRSERGRFQEVGLRHRSSTDAVAPQDAGDSAAIDIELLGDDILGGAGHIGGADCALINGEARPDWYVALLKSAADSSGGQPSLVTDLSRIQPAQIELDAIVDVTCKRFSGHVYNLHTEHGFYVADGVVTHNCRCDVLAVLNDELPEHGAEEE
jgi:hypothetical protein